MLNELSPNPGSRSPRKRVGRGDDCLQYQGTQPAWQCTFSPDGTYLAVCFGAPDPFIRIWNNK